MNDIFQSDFIIHTMIQIMTPCELYHFRKILRVTYNWITIDVIKKKIIKMAKTKLKHTLGDKYAKFINMIAKRNVTIYGPWVTQLFYGEDWNTPINLQIMYANIDKVDSIFLDYANMDDLVQYNYNIYDEMSNIFNYEKVFSCVLNPYEKTISKIIVLNVYASYIFDNVIDFDEEYEYSPIFQNKINIINHWNMDITNIHRVMYRTEVLDLRKNYYDTDYDRCDITRNCEQYNIKIFIKKLDSYIGSQSQKIPLIVYNNNRIIFCDCIMELPNNELKIEKTKVINSKFTNEIYTHDLWKCGDDPFFCTFEELNIEHYHSDLYIQQNKYNDVIFLKYDENNPIFDRYIDISNQSKNPVNYIDGSIYDLSIGPFYIL